MWFWCWCLSDYYLLIWLSNLNLIHQRSSYEETFCTDISLWHSLIFPVLLLSKWLFVPGQHEKHSLQLLHMLVPLVVSMSPAARVIVSVVVWLLHLSRLRPGVRSRSLLCQSFSSLPTGQSLLSQFNTMSDAAHDHTGNNITHTHTHIHHECDIWYWFFFFVFDLTFYWQP